METSELRDERWLLAYEASVNGWLSSATGGDHIAADAEFAALRAGGVSFYNASASCVPPVPIRRLRSTSALMSVYS